MKWVCFILSADKIRLLFLKYKEIFKYFQIFRYKNTLIPTYLYIYAANTTAKADFRHINICTYLGIFINTRTYSYTLLYLYTPICGDLNIQLLAYFYIPVSVYLNIKVFTYPGIRISRYSDTWTLDYPDICE